MIRFTVLLEKEIAYLQFLPEAAATALYVGWKLILQELLFKVLSFMTATVFRCDRVRFRCKQTAWLHL